MGNFRVIEHATKRHIIRLWNEGEPRHNIARILDVSYRTVCRVLTKNDLIGDVALPATNAGRRRVLTWGDLEYLEGCIERQPDSTLEELRDALSDAHGKLVHKSVISRALRRRGLTMKDLTRPAEEATEDSRTRFRLMVGARFPPECLVFVDESHCNRFTTRRKRGWAPIGNRARRRDFFIRGQRYSVLPAMSLDGILHCFVQDHSYTGEEFAVFIEGLLNRMNPYPEKNSVIVVDNASIHKSEDLVAMVEARGMRLIYLPPYSPDLNPIEESFSAMKAWIRDNRAYCLPQLDGHDYHDPYTMLLRAVAASVDAQKAWGWFSHSGYVVNENVQ